MCLGKTNKNKSKLQIFLEAGYADEGMNILPMAHYPFTGRQSNNADNIRALPGA